MTLTKTPMSNLKIQIWERLNLAIGEPGKEGVYSCRVTDIKKGILIISRPVFQYGDTLLANNRIVSVRFTRADAAYSFRARLVEDEPKSGETMRLVELGKIERLQRRRFVRLDMVFPVAYKVLNVPLEEEVELKGKGFFQGRSLNISAGGILIQSTSEIMVNRLLLLECSKSGLKNLCPYLIGICRQVRQDEKKNWLAGLEFILKDDLSKHLGKDQRKLIPQMAKKFDDRCQNALVTELFTQQVILRQKGLL